LYENYRKDTDKISMFFSYFWHLIMFDRHRDNVDADHDRYCHVKILASDDCMQIEAWLGIQRPIGSPQQLYNNQSQARTITD